MNIFKRMSNKFRVKLAVHQIESSFVSAFEEIFKNSEILEQVGDEEKYPIPTLWIPNDLVKKLKLFGVEKLESFGTVTKIKFPENVSWKVTDRAIIKIIDRAYYILEIGDTQVIRYQIGLNAHHGNMESSYSQLFEGQ